MINLKQSFYHFRLLEFHVETEMSLQVIRKECVERPFGRADVAKPARTEKPAKLVSHCKRSSTVH